MAFVKVVKNGPYMSRFQTKLKRRRQGKTDYKARRALTRQDGNKYLAKKYRLVVRFSNVNVKAQIVQSTLTGDKIKCEANSWELKKWGLTTGLKNYAASYCTGLLLARRILTEIKLNEQQPGAKETSGDDQQVEDSDEKRAFRAVLDVGLKRTTTGARLFGVLKGALDGGLHIPHSANKYPGCPKPKSENEQDAEIHKNQIFGKHIDDQMKYMKDDSELYKTKYNKQFSQWDKCLKASGVKSCSDLYTKIHGLIRKNPNKQAKKPNEYTHKIEGNFVTCKKIRWLRNRKISNEAKKKNANDKIQRALDKQNKD